MTDNSRVRMTKSRQLLVTFNAAHGEQNFLLPPDARGDWRFILDTATPESAESRWSEAAPDTLGLTGRSVIILTTAAGTRSERFYQPI